jgi:DNA helicase II / ATP-dependent DNA helicase PcrA
VEWSRSEAAPSRFTSRFDDNERFGSTGSPTNAGRANFSSAAMRLDAASKAKPARAIPSLAPGDRVLHDSFGLGTVVALEGQAEKSVASVDFGSQGVKRLLLRYAPLDKL